MKPAPVIPSNTEYNVPVFIPASDSDRQPSVASPDQRSLPGASSDAVYRLDTIELLESLATAADSVSEATRYFEVVPHPEVAAPVARPETIEVWGTPFSRLDMRQAIELADRVIQAGHPEYFITANLNYLMLTDHHPRLAEVNEHCLCMLADGAPIVARSRLANRSLPSRVAGADMIIELARLAEERGYRVFFLGGAPGVAQRAAHVLRRRFPNLQVAGTHCPPFRPLTAGEQSELIQSIRASGADILLVAFGQPKGEFWIYEHRWELGVPLSIQLGASFDFLAGTARRAPKFWQAIGCEWLYRAFSDPQRLVPRYARNGLFLGKLLLSDLRALFTSLRSPK
jgi:N-acetylglucosaminyldiphosphoundecaprenol N-acetyl-beta-D-mannosaminyltransferase